MVAVISSSNFLAPVEAKRNAIDSTVNSLFGVTIYIVKAKPRVRKLLRVVYSERIPDCKRLPYYPKDSLRNLKREVAPECVRLYQSTDEIASTNKTNTSYLSCPKSVLVGWRGLPSISEQNKRKYFKKNINTL